MNNRETSKIEIDDETLQRIEDRVLLHEKDQLSYESPYNIIPKLKKVVEEEIPEVHSDEGEEL